MNEDNFDPQTGIVITILAGIFIFLMPYPINTLGMIFFPIGFLILDLLLLENINLIN